MGSNMGENRIDMTEIWTDVIESRNDVTEIWTDVTENRIDVIEKWFDKDEIQSEHFILTAGVSPWLLSWARKAPHVKNPPKDYVFSCGAKLKCRFERLIRVWNLIHSFLYRSHGIHFQIYKGTKKSADYKSTQAQVTFTFRRCTL